MMRTRPYWLPLFLVIAAGCIRVETMTRPTPTPFAAVVYVAAPTGNDAAGTPCTNAQPCSIRRGLLTMSCTNNDVLELLDGIYQGANYMLNLDTHVPGKSGTDDAHRCTVRARNDGGVFIDGQFARTPMILGEHSYWTFQGFDLGNGAGGVVNFRFLAPPSRHVTFQRICASNANLFSTRENAHVWMLENVHDSLFEDICGFGVGRNILQSDFNSGSGSKNNMYRRVWLRHEGYPGYDTNVAACGAPGCCDSGPAMQAYHSNAPYDSTNENWINIHSFENVTAGHHCYSPNGPTTATGNGSHFADSLTALRAHTIKGFIAWAAEDNRYSLNHTGLYYPISSECPANDPGPYVLQDVFIDVRSQKIPAFVTGSTAACLTMDRLTGLRVAGDTPTWSQWGTNTSTFNGTAQPTNFKECTTLGACPNFYTGAPGTSGGLGSRACYEYQDGALQDGTGGTTARPLWPWRMDGRIKKALERARNAGTGGATLAGTAGTGYEANTVTSEIVSRYGAVPPACLRTSLTPNPPAGLTLTQLWRSIWTPLAELLRG